MPCSGQTRASRLVRFILLLDDLLCGDSRKGDRPSPNRQLVCDCLTLIERSEKQSTIHARGTRLITLLLQHNK